MCDLRGSLGRRNRQQLNTNRNLFCVRPHSRRFILVAEEKWISRSSFICSSIMPGTDDLEALVVQQEAKRFENFHESVLHLHELLEELDNVALKRKMRQALTRIEDCFLSSPEFTTGRLSASQELKLGIVGSAVSGKSFLLQCYLSGSQTRMESSYTGRYKKEVKFRGSSYLLLVRDETGPPDLQFTQWVDAIMFVFSLDDELSLSVIHQYYSRMSQYRNIVDVPVILVAMKDGVTNDHPSPVCSRHISKLVTDLKQCVYVEASAFNGENVDHTFQTAVEKLIQAKTDSPVLTSFDPVHSPTAKEEEPGNLFSSIASPSNNNYAGSGHNSATSTPSSSTKRGSRRRTMLFSKEKKEKEKDKDVVDGDFGSGRSIPLKQGYLYKRSATSINKEWKKKYVTLCCDGSVVYYPNLHDYMNDVHSKAIALKHTTVKVPGKRPPKAAQSQGGSGSRPTTPVDPSLFSENNNCGSNPDSLERTASIPNGFDSNLQTPRSSTSDMENILANIGTSMIIPNSNVVPVGSSNFPTTPTRSDSTSVVKKKNKRSKHTKSCEIDYEELEKAFAAAANNATVAALEVQPSSLKKKGHRRVKSGSGKFDTDSESSGWEFTVVSLEGKMWQFEAATAEERDTWVQAIEQQILSCLQSNESNREKCRKGSTTSSDSFDVQAIRNAPGNSECVDCRTANPDWASLNLGALMCIECSGVHRNLGTHLSRVRSLDLDEWPSELTAVMCSIGNSLANRVWEGKNDDNRQPPSPASSREEKERWIRAKYESKEMLKDLPHSDFSLGEQLHDAVSKEDLLLCILLLAHCCTEDVSAASDDADGFSPLHISCSLGNIVITQLLIWSFADVKRLDAKGRSALWYAKSAGSKECADILRHNGCNDLGTMIPKGSDVVC